MAERLRERLIGAAKGRGARGRAAKAAGPAGQDGGGAGRGGPERGSGQGPAPGSEPADRGEQRRPTGGVAKARQRAAWARPEPDRDATIRTATSGRVTSGARVGARRGGTAVPVPIRPGTAVPVPGRPWNADGRPAGAPEPADQRLMTGGPAAQDQRTSSSGPASNEAAQHGRVAVGDGVPGPGRGQGGNGHEPCSSGQFHKNPDPEAWAGIDGLPPSGT